MRNLRHLPAALLRASGWLVTLLALAAPAGAGERLERIRSESTLVCGVSDAVPGFAQRDAAGHWSGLEVDLCRAIATALLGPGGQLRLQPIDTVHQLLAEPRIDLVFHRLTWTLTREAPGQLEFGPVYLYDIPQDMDKEPLAPLLHSDDAEFARIVRWTLLALIEAEELGIDSRNVTEAPQARDWPPADTALALGLPADWARQVVRQVGNYGEIYARHLGPNSAQPRPRGLNRLWRDGGLLIAPPLL